MAIFNIFNLIKKKIFGSINKRGRDSGEVNKDRLKVYISMQAVLF
jgi:hypothetical protein